MTPTGKLRKVSWEAGVIYPHALTDEEAMRVALDYIRAMKLMKVEFAAPSIVHEALTKVQAADDAS